MAYNLNLVTGGAMPDDSIALSYLNSVRRGFVSYAVAQNITKLSPLVKILLDRADQRDWGIPFVVQPVVGSKVYSAFPMGFTGEYTSSSINPPNILAAQFNPAEWGVEVRISRNELLMFQNNPLAVVDIVSARSADAFISLMEALTSQLLGSRTTSGVEDPLKFYGLKDMIDDGTQCPNYGNISRSTYAWWASDIYNTTSLWSDYSTVPAFTLVQRGLSRYINRNSAAGLPTIGVCSFATFQKIAESFTGVLDKVITQDVTEVLETRSYRVMGIDVNGVPIFPDPWLASDSGVIYFLNLDHVKLSLAKGLDFVETPFESLRPVQLDQYSSLLVVGGQLWCDAPYSCFKMINFPTVSNV